MFWERMSTIKTAADVVSGNPDEGDDPNADPESLDGSSAARLHFWSVAIDMARDRPITGVGHNCYNVAYDQYDTAQGHFGHQRSVHSAWFGMLAELGFPGFMLFVALIGVTFMACQRARRAAKAAAEHAHLANFAFAIEAGLIAFMVGGSFVPFQYNEMLWHTFGLGIALNALAVKALADSKVTQLAVDVRSVGIGVPTATPTA
jgi:O-antigen ligase